jgi:hypothetical protein
MTELILLHFNKLISVHLHIPIYSDLLFELFAWRLNLKKIIIAQEQKKNLL